MTMYDLNLKLLSLTKSSCTARFKEAIKSIPEVGVVGLNGIPFKGVNPTYFGVPVSNELIHSQFREGIGMGGVLTHMNNSMSGDELCDLSLMHGHDFAAHSIHVTICVVGAPTFVEMSFGRDGRFHMSWFEPKGRTDWNEFRIFTASASIKRWKKYLSNRNSKDFLNTQKKWLEKINNIMTPMFPEYFNN